MPNPGALFGVFVNPINGREIIVWDGETRVILGIPVMGGLVLIAIFKVIDGSIVQEWDVVRSTVRCWISATTTALLKGRDVAIIGW